MSRESMVSNKRVAITGMGAVTPPGHSLDATWQAILERHSCADTISKYKADHMPTKIGYEIRDFKFDRSLVSDREWEKCNDAAKFAIAATSQAIDQAKLGGINTDPHRIAVSMGSGMGSPEFDWFARVFTENRYDDPSATELLKNFPYSITQIISRMVGAHGGSTTVHTACASSGQSVGEAFEMVACGERDVVVTGGTDSMINPFHMAGFCLLGALSKRNDDPSTASRPFDSERDGFVLGEGACTLVLEEWEHAKNRGAKILGELCGYGCTESAYRITDLHPEGNGPIQAMQMALDDAKIAASAVGYVNAHGTSTLLNDRIESLAIDTVFGDDNPQMRVSSTKSVTGHLISAAGALELAIAVKSLQTGILPPSTNLFEKDPQCRARICGADALPLTGSYALSNSVGFGGSNTALVARRVEL